MKAATMKERPSFPLMRQTDVQTIYHMQMPRWLFSDPRYAGTTRSTPVHPLFPARIAAIQEPPILRVLKIVFFPRPPKNRRIWRQGTARFAPQGPQDRRFQNRRNCGLVIKK